MACITPAWSSGGLGLKGLLLGQIFLFSDNLSAADIITSHTSRLKGFIYYITPPPPKKKKKKKKVTVKSKIS